jgi:acetyltransferase-like isoleucine patch superfamily enzyme
VEQLREDFAPWSFEASADASQRADRERRTAELRTRGYAIGTSCVVSTLAAVHPDTLSLGDGSYIAAHAHVTGDVSLGADCSVNVGAAVRGRVTAGRAVRIGASTSILGFDHGFDDLDVDMFRQPLTSIGIRIGDDVWIGAHVVVVDGVTIGSHSVIGAGAVVTRSVPDWAIVVGNPARVVGDRRTRRAVAELAPRVAELAARARAELPGILDRAFDGRYRDRPGVPPTIRAHADAIELSMMLRGEPPAQLTRQEHVDRLRGAQDPVSGLVPEIGGRDEAAADARPHRVSFPDQDRAYHVLSVGYALDLLGSSFEHPVRTITELRTEDLLALLDELPWSTDAWGSGALVDSVGTALSWELRAGRAVAPGLREALVGWLLDHRDPGTGLWGGRGDVSDAELGDAVNGTFRLVRGTFAQWDIPLAGADRLTASLLRRAEQVLGSPDATACDVLDVVHPLHLVRAARPDLPHRPVDVVAVAVLDLIVARWVPGRGVAFGPGREPSLQGTEMWLAIAWYAADLVGLADALAYRPSGVHRPGPMTDARASARVAG